MVLGHDGVLTTGGAVHFWICKTNGTGREMRLLGLGHFLSLRFSVSSGTVSETREVTK